MQFNKSVVFHCFFFFSGERKKYKKPKRPCLFCQEHFCDLTRHLKRQHNSEEKVKLSMALPKKQRLAQFDKLRKEGILIYNRKIQGSKTDLMRERRQGNEDLVICCGCQQKKNLSAQKEMCRQRAMWFQRCGCSSKCLLSRCGFSGIFGKSCLFL